MDNFVCSLSFFCKNFDLHAKCDLKKKKKKIVKCPFTLYNKSKRQQKQFEKKKEKMK